MQASIFYFGTIAFLFGIAFATVYTPALLLPYLVFVTTIGFSWLLVAQRFKRQSLAWVPRLIGIIILLFVIGVGRGYLEVQKFSDSPLASDVGQTVSVTGIVSREPDVRERSIHLHVQLPDVPHLVLVTTDRYTDVGYGDSITVSGTLDAPSSFETDLGRTFRYAEYLKAKNIQYRIAFAEITVVASDGGNRLLRSLLSFKEAFVNALETVLPHPQSGLGVGLLLGVKEALGTELEMAFRKTGLIHIVVLSGYNVMLVVSFVLFFLALFLPLRWRIVFGLLAITLFALLVGLSATVVRASIMAGLYLLAPLFGRRYHILRALCIAGLLMVFIQPYILLYDIGFQLSFVATLGLILLAPKFEFMAMTNPALLTIRNFFIATLATQIAVAPLLLYQIGELSLIALVVNVLVLPMVGVAMLLTFITGVCALYVPAVAELVAIPAYWSLQYIITLAEWFATLPYAVMVVPSFPWWLLVISYGVMGGCYYGVVVRRGQVPNFEQTFLAGDVTQKQETNPRHDTVSTDTTSTPFKNWTIVAEHEYTQIVSAKSTSNVPPKNSMTSESSSEPPIFFR